MYLYVILLIAEIITLFELSKKVQRKLGGFFYGVFKNKKRAIYAMSILFLPGTFVHEMSHFLAALILFVPVGKMQLIPRINGDNIELGSVTIAKTDFIRSFFISIAPLVIGSCTVLSVIFFAFTYKWYENFWLVALLVYFVFTVTNTMFISKKDAQGTIGFIVFIIFITVVVVLLGLNIRVTFEQNSEVFKVISKSVLLLLIPVALDILILFGFK